MNYLAVLYAGDEARELNFSRESNSVTGSEDLFALQKICPVPARFTVSPLEMGVHVSSSSPVKVCDDDTVNCVLSIGETARVNEHVSISVLEKHSNQGSVSLKGVDEITLGRSSQNDICMRGSQVSANHALFSRQGDVWRIEDRGSKNGTFVNGKAVRLAALKEKDSVFIGGWKLIFRSGSLYIEYAAGETVFSQKLINSAACQSKHERKAQYPFFQRSPRIQPNAETPEIEILSPPNRGAKPSVSWLSVLLPPVMMIAVMLCVSVLTGNKNVLIYSVPMSGVSIAVSVINYRSQMKKWEETRNIAHKKYASHLKTRDTEITAAETNYLSALTSANPGVYECVGIASRIDRRLWERSPDDRDFLKIRLGRGRVCSNVSVRIPQEQLSIEEDPLLKEAAEIRKQHEVLDGVPITHSFLETNIIGIAGNRAAIKKIVWTVIAGVAALHSYEDVKIVCVYPENEKRDWEWVRWLPHVWDAKRERRFVACNRDDAKALLRDMAETLKNRRREVSESGARGAKTEIPFYFLLLADKELAECGGEQLLPESSELGMTAVYAYGDIGLLPGECRSIIDCGDSMCTLRANLSLVSFTSFTPEKISPELMDTFARSLAPIRLRSLGQSVSMPGYITFLQGYGVNRVEELDVMGRWARNQPFLSLSAPLGVKENGEIFEFNIHEKGHGPHGIVAGATRWGKSETLTTWLLSLALNYPPHEVSFVLIDFKGDGLSGILLDLPHVAGIISNVDDISSIERNLRSLQGELLRRQRVFKETKLENIHKYQEAYRAGKVSEAMAYLIIVIDEFAELKTQFPDQMNGFISVARTGGSLGVYMTLATQSPGGIVAGQVSANSRFRICLKTSEAGESREILGTTDAFRITTRGRAYVKVGNNEVYDLVQTFYSKAPYRPSSSSSGPSTKINIVSANGERILPEVYDRTKAAGGEEGRAVAQYIIRNAADYKTVRPVWTNPLSDKIFLSDLSDGHEAFKDGKWTEINKGLSFVAGLIDDPENQRQYPLSLDFMKNGHHAVYGAPSSGKTTFLQTVVFSAAVLYTPEQVQFMVLDFGNWGMKIFENLPHTLLAADANDTDKLKNAAEFLVSELDSRKRCFAEQGVGTLEAYREVTGEQMPAILIIIDNMAALHDRAPELPDILTGIAREGGGLGLYLLLSAGSISGTMFRLAQYIKASIALQLTDKNDYRQIVGGSSRQEPGHFPGRGFTKGALEFQTALCVNGESDGERVKQLRSVCSAMNGAWSGKRPQISAVWGNIDASSLAADEEMVQIGIDMETFAPYEFVFREMNGCVISGPPHSGKTNVLGLIVRALDNDPATRLYVYEKGSALSSLRKGKSASDGAAFDELVSEMALEYDRRENGGEIETRIVICADDFSQFYRDISDESADKLTRIAEYGAELGMYIYVSGDRDRLAIAFSDTPLFKSCMKNGNAIALGNNLKEHALFSPLIDDDGLTLDKGECCVIHERKVHRVKLAKAVI